MSRLLDRLTGRAAPTIGGQTSWQTMFPRRWSADGETLGTDLRDYAENGYSANGIIFALVGARLALFSQAEVKFQQLSTRRLFGTQALRLLESPWPGGTTADLLARMEQDASLAGNAYVYRAGDRLVRLRPDWVEVAHVEWTDEAGFEHYDVIGYVYREDGYEDPAFLPVEDVAHWTPVPDPLKRHLGMSWVTPVVREVQADKQMTAYRASFFDNAATPNLLIKYQQKLSPQTVQAIRERWQARYGGASAAGATVVLDEGADVTVVGQSFEQMTFEAVQKAGEARMASAAGVPPIVAGLGAGLDASTYSNYAQALRSFANGTMQHLWTSAAAALAKLVDVPAGARLTFDTGNIPALQDAETDRATAAHIYSQAASVLITAGFEPESVQNALVAGDMSLLVHSGMVSVQLQSPGAVPAQPPAPRFDAHMHIEDGAFRPVVEVQPAAAPVVRNYYDIDVDGTTALTEGAVVVNAPVTVPERSVEVTVPPAPAPGPVRKRIETDDAGRITAVIEERA